MNNPQLWYSKKTNMYFYSEIKSLCANCNNILVGLCGFIREVSKTQDITNFYCLGCYHEHEPNPLTKVSMKGIATISEVKPKDAILVIGGVSLQSISRDSDISVFDISEINKLGGTTADKTIYANRSHKLGDLKRQDQLTHEREQEVLKICEDKDKTLTLGEVFGELNTLKNAKPIRNE